jgi:diguanylate cyclase (GGDEF)-like protein
MKLLERSQPLKIIFIALIVTACLSLPAYFIYQSAKRLIINDLNNNAINIASTVAFFLEQDIEAYKSLPPDDATGAVNSGDAYYNALTELFDRIKNVSGAARIYTENRMAKNGQDYLLRWPIAAPPGSLSESDRPLTPEERRVLDEGINLPSGLIRDETKGEYIIGYAPVIDGKTGEPVGIVGVEYPLTYAQRLIIGFGNIIWMSFFVIMLLISFVIHNLINSRRKYYKEDYMTGVYSKRYFDRELASALCYVKKKGRKLSLIMVDVDFFKSINDTFGHTIGDAVLKSVAAHMKTYIRYSDMCCRYGGDEFVITLINTDKEQAFEIAERIRNEVTCCRLKAENGEPVRVSLSMGVAEYDETESAEKLVEHADKAMYISKNTGKNRTTVYVRDVNDSSDRSVQTLRPLADPRIISVT